MKQLQMERLECRRLLVAPADTVLDIFPGPLHSEPELIGYLGEDALFSAMTEWQGPRHIFRTDGSSEGTVNLTSTLPAFTQFHTVARGLLLGTESGVHYIHSDGTVDVIADQRLIAQWPHRGGMLFTTGAGTYYIRDDGTLEFVIAQRLSQLEPYREGLVMVLQDGTYVRDADGGLERVSENTHPVEIWGDTIVYIHEDFIPDPWFPTENGTYRLTYEDSDGRHFVYETPTDFATQEPVWAFQFGPTFGEYVVFMQEFPGDDSPIFLARGSEDEWIQITHAPFGSIFFVANSQLLFDIGNGTVYDTSHRLLSSSDGTAISSPDWSVSYNAADSEILRLGESNTWEPFFDFTTHPFEFPTTFRSFVSATGDSVVANIWDPVYEDHTVEISSDGSVTPYIPDPPPPPPPPQAIWQLTPFMQAKGYSFVKSDDVIYAVLGEAAFATGLPADRDILSAGGERFVFPDYDGIATGRELTSRRFRAGDANLDGFFDSSDLVSLLALGEYEDSIADNSHFLTGDFNGDGDFNSGDLVAALAEGWYEADETLNRAPLAQDQEVVAYEDTSQAITLSGSDPDGDSLTYNIVSGPSFGTLSEFDPSTGSVIYLPNPGYRGDDSFTFTANDGAASSSAGTVSITVVAQEPNDLGTNLLANSGFEVHEDTVGLPTQFRDWGGDLTAIVETTDGVTPIGSRMLQLISTAPTGAGGRASDILQYADLAPFREHAETGRLVARLTAYFNRVDRNDQTDTEFVLVLAAHEGSPESSPGQATSLVFETASLFTDGDLATWEPLTIELPVPDGAEFLQVTLAAMENVFDNRRGVELDGHFADDASLILYLEDEPDVEPRVAIAAAADTFADEPRFLRRKARTELGWASAPEAGQYHVAKFATGASLASTRAQQRSFNESENKFVVDSIFTSWKLPHPEWESEATGIVSVPEAADQIGIRTVVPAIEGVERGEAE